ncbi:hypothetical protein I0P70_16715 [Pontibacter sp. FD36]|uniref:hypothetical protein n=1 Tax=Pontibacter sp. FD36 TaxID=2789860 RepID=UPI0018AC67CE|nr:hypothetical protein [Pontibacter sp. FD36]MBF8964893.1 hypothetical protein [Pontibacter sp. FD36]
MNSIDKLYLKPVGGLCNRMRAIDSGVTLAEQLGKRLVVFWGRDQWLNCKYSDLFKPSLNFDVIEEKQWAGKKALFPYLPGSKPTSLTKKSLYALTKKTLDINAEIWYEDIGHAVAQIDTSIQPENIRDMKDYEVQSFKHINPLVQVLNSKGSAFVCSAWKLASGQRYAQNFIPIDKLQSQINELSKRFLHTVGVHIRRSDHKMAIEHSPIQSFISAIEHEIDNNNANFFLATDCEETEKELLNRYSNRITICPKSSYSRSSAQGIQEALIDLYCLSKTSKVLGSYYSSFSQVAAEISGIEEITIH